MYIQNGYSSLPQHSMPVMRGSLLYICSMFGVRNQPLGYNPMLTDRKWVQWIWYNTCVWHAVSEWTGKTDAHTCHACIYHTVYTHMHHQLIMHQNENTKQCVNMTHPLWDW